jgi:hypothetical protein
LGADCAEPLELAGGELQVGGGQVGGQLFLGTSAAASVARPVRELKGFTRIDLDPVWLLG